MVRQATPFDMDGIISLGLEALALSDDGVLTVDQEKVKRQAITCLFGKKNFAWVSVDNNKVVGALLAEVHAMTFHKGNQASVVQFYCKKPGDGVKLLNKFIEWFDSRPLNALVFTLEHGQDDRLVKLLSRKGFSQQFPALMRVKHVENSQGHQKGYQEDFQRRQKSL